MAGQPPSNPSSIHVLVLHITDVQWTTAWATDEGPGQDPLLYHVCASAVGHLQDPRVLGPEQSTAWVLNRPLLWVLLATVLGPGQTTDEGPGQAPVVGLV